MRQRHLDFCSFGRRCGKPCYCGEHLGRRTLGKTRTASLCRRRRAASCRARQIIDAGVDDFAIARADPRTSPALAFDDNHLPPRPGERPRNSKPDDARTEDETLNRFHPSRSKSMSRRAAPSEQSAATQPFPVSRTNRDRTAPARSPVRPRADRPASRRSPCAATLLASRSRRLAGRRW
jgi:hypothetical protein